MYVQAREQLKKVFHNTPLFIFDNETLFEEAKSQEVDALYLGAKDINSISATIPNDIILVVTDRSLPKFSELAPELRNRNILQIPTHAFNGCPEVTRYTIEMCKNLDLADCVKKNSSIIKELQKDKDFFSLKSTKSDISFHLFSDIKIMQVAIFDLLENHEDYALSTFTEVALIPNHIDINNTKPSDLGYDINGSFKCDGCLTAIHHGMPDEILRQKELIDNFISSLHNESAFPLKIKIKGSKVFSIHTNNREVTNAFLSEMHGTLSNNIIELGIGTNKMANTETINWKHNSPINESALGFHLAIGDGAMCPHVDFICASEEAFNSFFEAA